MKKILSFLLAVCMIVTLLSACGQKPATEEKAAEEQPTEASKSSSSSSSAVTVIEIDAADIGANPVSSLKAEASSDKYRSYYQVWIGAFYDSDGDKSGDLPGIVEKLDYINDGDVNGGEDLGADGIWLSPMMPSSTYHKYNVEDYFSIDPAFGTLDDFDKLIEECHKRGIVVVIDLVLNHAGAGHEYFQKACEELADGKEDGFARYFNFSKTQDSVYQHKVPNADYYYQGDFWDQMPDWNLSFDGTREYFDKVTKFWLDRGVDGFRLDAVKYFEDDHTDGEEFLKWFCDMARGYNPDVYIVGEDWDDVNSNVYRMYDSGVDSLFNFKFANASGDFSRASHGTAADMCAALKKYDDNIKKHNENAINANFLTNHDMVRVFNNLDESDNKMAAAMYMLAPGNSFTYYGEEIGMESVGNEDPFKRTAMIWDNDNLPVIVTDGTAGARKTELGGVAQQLPEEHSLLNTYRRLIKLRQQNPEIARGSIAEVCDFGEQKCGGYIIEYNGSRVLVIHNVSDEDMEMNVDMIDNPELRGWASADFAEEPSSGGAILDGTTLKLSARTSVVLKENK